MQALGDLGESSVAVIVVEKILLPIVRNVKVRESIVIVVSRGHRLLNAMRSARRMGEYL